MVRKQEKGTDERKVTRDNDKLIMSFLPSSDANVVGCIILFACYLLSLRRKMKEAKKEQISIDRHSFKSNKHITSFYYW